MPPEQGWLVGEFQVGIGNGSSNGEPVVVFSMKMVGLPDVGTYVMLPKSAREFALQLSSAADELEKKPNGSG